MKPAGSSELFPDLLDEVGKYYSTKLAEHGPTPRGVDWNGDESQSLRFQQLEKLVVDDARFSVNDIGCGYGAMLEFLERRHADFDYMGCDISPEMVDAARARFNGYDRADFAVGTQPAQIADYGFASGIFNVRLGRSDEEWQAYMTATLDVIGQTSKRGFAFNCLTSYSDPDKMRDYLYYADPGKVFDLCKRRYSRHVALLHDYGLYEFTILVRKDI